MKKNILFLMTDQHRVDTLGAYGNQVVPTPNLDRLAATGALFRRCYTPTAICTPARASLLTGQQPFRHRLLANQERNVGYSEDLAPGTFTFPEALRDAGYACGLIGKWHIGTKRNAASYGFEGPDLPGWHNPVDHEDYQRFLAERSLPAVSTSCEIRSTYPNGTPGNLLAARLHQPVEATFEAYLATRAIELLRVYADRYRELGAPFFLELSFFGPHLPYLLPDEYFDLVDPAQVRLPESTAETFEGKPPVQREYSAHWGYDTLSEEQSRKLIAIYWGYVAMIDAQVGRVLDALDETGLTDHTAVFFTADHGEFTGAHRLHDKGPAMYEDIYRIPGMIRVPGQEPTVRDELVLLTDFTATILELAGVDPSPAVDSRTLMPLIRGEDVEWPEEIVCEFHGHHFPYTQRMLRTGDYKLVVNPESTNELYDLRRDPDELENRYHDPVMVEIRDRLVQRLYEILRTRGDNFYHWMTSADPVGVQATTSPSRAPGEVAQPSAREEPRPRDISGITAPGVEGVAR